MSIVSVVSIVSVLSVVSTVSVLSVVSTVSVLSVVSTASVLSVVSTVSVPKDTEDARDAETLYCLIMPLYGTQEFDHLGCTLHLPSTL